ncbi:MAG: 5-formyltetrahydrofolate cyclo-ligase, partial [Oscillospiraceae bacterium]|nr:5-formyltetrahydrofolate cyclo-ligase [Oscillospiraceae bacterium]
FNGARHYHDFGISFRGGGMTDQRFAEMIQSGYIPSNITRLEISGGGLTHINDIPALTNLSNLILDGNHIETLAPLAHLDNLLALEITNNPALTDDGAYRLFSFSDLQVLALFGTSLSYDFIGRLRVALPNTAIHTSGDYPYATSTSSRSAFQVTPEIMITMFYADDYLHIFDGYDFYADMEMDQEIARRVVALREFQAAATIFCFLGVGAEIDTRPILDAALQMGKTLCLPRCGRDGLMEPVPVADLDALTETFYGIPQPSIDLPPLPPGAIDLAVVPGIAFDRQGYRLGQGGGYYDRFLPKLKGVALGICRAALILPTVPREDHDQPVSILVTEKEIAELKS